MSRRTRSNAHVIRRLIGAVLIVVGVVAGLAPLVSAEGGFTGPASSANARYVVEVYQQLLGRSADTEGLDFHLGRITAGGDSARERFTRSLLFSEEGSRAEVVRAYGELLGRSPESVGSTYWTDHLRTRGVVDLRVLLLASDEYHNRVGGTDEAWVDALYSVVLRRPADPSGRAYWFEQLDRGVPRVLVAAGIYLSDEALGNRADSYFQEALARLPTPSERTGAIVTIRVRGERGLRAHLWASSEAFESHLVAATAGSAQS